MSLEMSQPTPIMSALEQYAAYPFSSDDVYQQGLMSIMASGALKHDAAPEVRDEILRRTRVFYFNKTTGSNISMDEAREYELSILLQPGGGSSTSGGSDSTAPVAVAQEEVVGEPQVLSLAQLKELIESGKMDQIPNNKIIPEKFSDEAPSQSTAQPRRKPWEVAATTASATTEAS